MPSRGLLEVLSVHWSHSQQPQATWTACPLADQTFVGGSLASVHAPGLSCRHVTKSTHRASGYQQAAICYSCNRGGHDFSRARPAAKTYHAPRQQPKDRSNKPVQHKLLTASNSIDFSQGSSHRPSAWAGELPSISRSGKGEHRRHIITTGQTLSVSTSTFSLHLQLECSTKSLSTS